MSSTRKHRWLPPRTLRSSVGPLAGRRVQVLDQLEYVLAARGSQQCYLEVRPFVADDLVDACAGALVPALDLQTDDTAVELHGLAEVAHDKAGVVQPFNHSQLLPIQASLRDYLTTVGEFQSSEV